MTLTQGTDVVNQNLVPTNTDSTVSNVYGADPNQMTLTQGTDVVNQNLGPLNISNLGAVINPQAMNSNAGGVASLVSPQVINPGATQVLDSSGVPIPGRRKMVMAPV